MQLAEQGHAFRTVVCAGFPVLAVVSFTYVVCARDLDWSRCGYTLNCNYAASVVLTVRAPA